MAKLILLVVTVVVLCAQGNPVPQYGFPRFPFSASYASSGGLPGINSFAGSGAFAPFAFPQFHIPVVQPIRPEDYGKMFTQFGDEKIVTDGGVFQSQSFGLQGADYQSTMISSVTKDGKTKMVIASNKNGDKKVETVEI